MHKKGFTFKFFNNLHTYMLGSEDNFFNGLTKFNAPKEWGEFAKSANIIKVWVVNDESLSRSVRRIKEKEVYINMRTNAWKNYCVEPINAKTPEESILLKFLHELGHAINNHDGTPELSVTEQGLNPVFENHVRLIPINKRLDSNQEKEAWNFAISIRKNKPVQYEKLLKSYQNWLEKMNDK
jgi:hypothetical protein